MLIILIFIIICITIFYIIDESNELEFKNHFENKITNRLIYLFVVNMDNESVLCNPRFKNGKLWTLQQMEQNLKENLFCECLEVEYEYLKDIIYTTEKYKGS